MKNKCKHCGIETDNDVYCSRKCHQKYQKIHQTGICSNISRKKSTETNRKNKTGLFGMTKEAQREAGKKSSAVNRKNKTGAFFDNKIRRLNQIKGLETSRKNKVGFFDTVVQSKNGKRAIEKNRKNQIGIFDPNFVMPKNNTSIEIKLQEYLIELKIKFVRHKYMQIKHSYQCDIFIPSMNLVIEADGDAFHFYGDKYNDDSKIYATGRTALEQRTLDKQRTDELKQQGFNVLRLWGHEIRKMSVDDLKQKLAVIRWSH